MTCKNVDIISWNVRGLNAAARCLAVHETIRTTPCHIACLQETKLRNIDSSLANFLGAYRLNKFIYKPACCSRGGILLLWNDSTVDIQNATIGRYSITVEVTINQCRSTYKLSTVYDPSRNSEKEFFLNHLRTLKPHDNAKWIILGDFNLIYRARDKNNQNLNLCLMRRFRRVLNHCGLKEIALQNRTFTWSNERRRPTLVRLDRVFTNQSWDIHFDNCLLHALSSSHSDHCPLLLTNQTGPRRPTPFRFENFWVRLPQFKEVVQTSWNAPTHHTEPFHRLGHKLFTTSWALKKWSMTLIPDARMKLLMAQEVVLRLDEAMDVRDLSPEETWLRAKLKKRIMGWAVIEKARRKQCSRVLHLKEGDANTRFFHLKANGRRRKNYIHKLKNQGG